MVVCVGGRSVVCVWGGGGPLWWWWWCVCVCRPIWQRGWGGVGVSVCVCLSLSLSAFVLISSPLRNRVQSVSLSLFVSLFLSICLSHSLPPPLLPLLSFSVRLYVLSSFISPYSYICAQDYNVGHARLPADER